MFERNRVDNAPEVSAVPVEITLLDGTLIKGKLLVPILKTAADTLNGGTAFIEFEPYGGEKRYIAKAQLAAVKPVGVPRVPGLQSRLRDSGEFDPYAVLGLAHGAAREQIREAYVALAKAYHPDRYVNVVLPPEVGDYLAAMARRINAAHAALEAPEKRRAMRQEPIFTSPGR
jgi:DnaJ domain